MYIKKEINGLKFSQIICILWLWCLALFGSWLLYKMENYWCGTIKFLKQVWSCYHYSTATPWVSRVYHLSFLKQVLFKLIIVNFNLNMVVVPCVKDHLFNAFLNGRQYPVCLSVLSVAWTSGIQNCHISSIDILWAWLYWCSQAL